MGKGWKNFYHKSKPTINTILRKAQERNKNLDENWKEWNGEEDEE